MASIYNGPARGGNRGGKDLFNWDDVKEDKSHQSYLGHSVKAPIGRWQKGRDLHWYTKETKIDLKKAAESERLAIKAKEQDLMLQLLGEKPMEGPPRGDLDRIQKNKLLKKGDAEEGTVAAAITQDDFGERVEGIGYAPIKIDDLREAMEISTSTRLEGTGINDLIAAHAAGDGEDGHDGDDHAALLAAIEGAGGMGNQSENDSDSGKTLSKEEKKERKRLKKEMKKLHKIEKAERKLAKAAVKSKSKTQEPESKRARAADFMRHEHTADRREAPASSPPFNARRSPEPRRMDGGSDARRGDGELDGRYPSDSHGRREARGDIVSDRRSWGPSRDRRRSHSGERTREPRRSPDRGGSFRSRSRDRADRRSADRQRGGYPEDGRPRAGRGRSRSRSRSRDQRRSPRR